MPATIKPVPIHIDESTIETMPAMIKINPRMPMMARKVMELLSTVSSGSCAFSLGLVFGLVFCFGFGMIVKEKETKKNKIALGE